VLLTHARGGFTRRIRHILSAKRAEFRILRISALPPRAWNVVVNVDVNQNLDTLEALPAAHITLAHRVQLKPSGGFGALDVTSCVFVCSMSRFVSFSRLYPVKIFNRLPRRCQWFLRRCGLFPHEKRNPATGAGG